MHEVCPVSSVQYRVDSSQPSQDAFAVVVVPSCSSVPHLDARTVAFLLIHAVHKPHAFHAAGISGSGIPFVSWLYHRKIRREYLTINIAFVRFTPCRTRLLSSEDGEY